MIPMYWRREGYEEEAGGVAIVATASPGTSLSISHTFGPYEEDTYIRGLAKSYFAVSVTDSTIILEFYDVTNAVQVDMSKGSLENLANLIYDTPTVMWEGLLLTGNQLILSVRAFKSVGGATVEAYRAKAWYEVCRA